MTFAEVAEQAGVWVETVEHFARRGLLPREGELEPAHVALVRLVVRFQAEHQLSLDTLKAVVADECGHDLARAERALEARVEPDPNQAGPGPVTRARLATDSGVSAETLDTLVRAGVLPDAGPYGGHHVWMTESAAALDSLGIHRDGAAKAVALALEVAALETDALLVDVGRGAAPRDALRDSRERRAAVGRLLTAARSTTTAEQLARVARATAGSKELALVATHVPSPLFVARHRIDVAEAEAKARYEAGDTTAGRELARLLVGLGRFTEALQLLEGLARPPVPDTGLRALPMLAPEPVDAVLYRGLCLSLVGEDGDAIAAVEGAEAREPANPKASAFVAAAHFVAAGRSGDLLDATVHVEAALTALARSRALPARSAVEHAEARLTTGRIALVLPAAFGLAAGGRADLEAVLEATRGTGGDEAGYGVTGARDLVRITALFFLGSHLADHGDPGAPELLREVIALDPMANFARMAWRRLSQRNETRPAEGGAWG